MELLLPVILLVPLFLIFSRQRRQQREQLQLRQSLAPGQRVMTTAGMFGTVVALEGEQVRLEIAPGVVVEYVSAAIARIVTSDTTMPQTSTTDPASTDASGDAEAARFRDEGDDGDRGPAVIDLEKGLAPRSGDTHLR